MKNNNINLKRILRETTCKNCGKVIIRLSLENYWYKLKLKNNTTVYFCGYNCMRKFEKEYDALIMKKGGQKNND